MQRRNLDNRLAFLTCADNELVVVMIRCRPFRAEPEPRRPFAFARADAYVDGDRGISAPPKGRVWEVC